MKIGLFFGALKLYFDGTRENYPDFIHEHAFIKLLQFQGHEIVILTESDKPKKIIELDTFGIPYRYGSIDEVDIIFAAQAFITLPGKDAFERFYEKVLNANKRIIYRDSDEEVYRIKNNLRPQSRISMLAYLARDSYKDVFCFTSSKRSGEYKYLNTVPVAYLPVTYSQDCALRVKSHFSDNEISYLATLVGSLTGRKYYLDIIKKLQQDYNLPLNCGMYKKGNEVIALEVFSVNKIRAGLIKTDKYFSSINKSKFQIHGAGWYAPKLRKNQDMNKHPDYAVIKLLEGLYTNTQPYVLSLYTPELKDIGFPLDLIIDYPSLDFNIDLNRKDEIYKSLENLEVHNFSEQFLARF